MSDSPTFEEFNEIMRYSDVDEDPICEDFIADPKVNPRTKKRLMKGKGPYKALEKECEDYVPKRGRPRRRSPSPARSPSRDKCEMFLANPNKDPWTGKRVIKGKTTYKALMQRCEKYRARSRTPVRPKTPSPQRRRSSSFEDKCARFLANPNKDPWTGKRVIKGKTTYKALMAKCEGVRPRSPTPVRAKARTPTPPRRRTPSPVRRTPTPLPSRSVSPSARSISPEPAVFDEIDEQVERVRYKTIEQALDEMLSGVRLPEVEIIRSVQQDVHRCLGLTI